MLAIGTHESFLHKGWMCCECGEFFLRPKLQGYGAVICAFRMPLPKGKKPKIC